MAEQQPVKKADGGAGKWLSPMCLSFTCNEAGDLVLTVAQQRARVRLRVCVCAAPSKAAEIMQQSFEFNRAKRATRNYDQAGRSSGGRDCQIGFGLFGHLTFELPGRRLSTELRW